MTDPDLDPRNDAKIIDSWMTNAAPWTGAVRAGRIESRAVVTNQAIVDAILARSPRSVLDIGCGEGWLARALDARGIQVTGVDVVPALIEAAQRAGAGHFRTASYADITAGTLEVSADVVVCNFSLLGKDSVDGVFRAMPAMLSRPGYFIVQTLHPLTACAEVPYQDGWRDGSWEGFGAEFTDPAPWYFRTLGSWVTLFAANRLKLLEVREPLDARTRRPASVIFVATAC